MTIINGIPLYTTKKEALAWALANGVKGYHTHKNKGEIGYMGGATHSLATRVSLAKPIETNMQQGRPMQINEQRPIEPMRPQVTQQTRPQPQTQQTQRPVIRTTQPVRRTSTGGGGGY